MSMMLDDDSDSGCDGDEENVTAKQIFKFYWPVAFDSWCVRR